MKGDVSDLEAARLARLRDAARRKAAAPEIRPVPTADAGGAADAPDLSHDALALALESAPGWGCDARYCAAWGAWLFWDGARWLRDDRLDHMTRSRSYLRDRAEAVIAWAERKAERLSEGEAEKMRTWAKHEARTLRHKNTVAAVETLARSNPAMIAGADEFDRELMLLGTPGGTVDLRTGQTRPARRSDMITRQTAVAPAPGQPTLWLRFLDEIFAGDAEMIAFMQRAAGYALTGETREHKLLFLYGPGRNGKSVFLDTLAAIGGDYSRRAPATAFLKSTGEKHPTDIAGLRGARLVVGSELPAGKTWDEAVIKDLTGGGKMSARFMRGDFFDFDPQLTLMIAGNNQPSFHGVDEAIRARVLLVPFTVTIPPERRDQHLCQKLMAEAGQILSWAIEGALEWQGVGLAAPASITGASATYFEAEDVVGMFIADETVSMVGNFVSAADLHAAFSVWSQGQGINAWSQLTLIKELRRRGFTDAKSNGRRGLKGLRLK